MRALRILAFFAAFLGAGLFTTVHFDTYLMDFWKIRNCKAGGYGNDAFMFRCSGGVDLTTYGSGSIVLGIEDEAVASLEAADVVIVGNSRTQRSFAVDAMDDYFREKGLTYFVMATEGNNYEGVLLTFSEMSIDPKVLLINNEIFAADGVPAAFADIVAQPDKYETRFRFARNAQRFQRWVCLEEVPVLVDIYCSGRIGSVWRSHRTGQVLDMPQRRNTEAAPIRMVTGRPLGSFLGIYSRRAEAFFDRLDLPDACPVLYIVNSPRGNPDLLHAIAEDFGHQAAFADVPGLEVYDGSHMDMENSERWAAAFLPELDRAIDNCLDPDFDVRAAQVTALGESSYDDLGGFATTDADVVMELDVRDGETGLVLDRVRFGDTNGTRLTQTLETPVRAGETWEFSVAARSPDFARVRLQMVRACGRGAVETAHDMADLRRTPGRYSVRHTWEADHPCVMLNIQNFTPGAAVDVFGYDLKRVD